MRLPLITALAVLALAAPAGCPQAGDQTAPQLPAVSELATGDSAADDDADRRERVGAWLTADLDEDGLPNRVELDYGLDPENPADGLDIDGDGVPNFRDDDVDGDGITNDTDPDIDGDRVSNLIDADIDSDGVANTADFDMDADGIRNAWDWDDNSDRKDDTGDEEGALGQLEDEQLRFSAAVQALKDKIATAAELTDPTLRDKALKQYRSDLDDLLGQVSKVHHESQPLPVDGPEVQLIAASLANRFKWGGSETLASDLKTAISQLTPLHGAPQPGDDPGTFRPPDPTDAIDAVFRQATEIKDPKRKEAMGELQQRLDALVSLKSRLRQKEVTAVSCSDAVSKLVAMPGRASPQDKVDGLTRLWGVIEAPKLGPLVDDLGAMSSALASRADAFEFGNFIDTLTQLQAMPGVGTLREKFDGLMRVWDAVDTPELSELVDGLEKLTAALEDRLGDKWGWDTLAQVLENVPGIEDGIGQQQIDDAVEAVALIEQW